MVGLLAEKIAGGVSLMELSKDNIENISRWTGRYSLQKHMAKTVPSEVQNARLHDRNKCVKRSL